MELARAWEGTRRATGLPGLLTREHGNNPRLALDPGILASPADLDRLPACNNAHGLSSGHGGRQPPELPLERTSTPELQAAIWQQAAELGLEAWFQPVPGYSILDDHHPFLNAGIPAVDIIDFDYPWWHTVGDTMDKVGADSLLARRTPGELAGSRRRTARVR